MYGKTNNATRVGACQSFDEAARVYENAPKMRDSNTRRHFALRGTTPTNKHWIERCMGMLGITPICYRIIMWKTVIAEFHADGTIDLSSGGWMSNPTTRDFIRAILPRFDRFLLAGNSGRVAYEGDVYTLYRGRETYYPTKPDYTWRALYADAFGYAQLQQRKIPDARVEFCFSPGSTVVFKYGDGA